MNFAWQLSESIYILFTTQLMFLSLICLGFSILRPFKIAGDIAWYESLFIGWMATIIIGWYSFALNIPLSPIIKLIFLLSLLFLILQGSLIDFFNSHKEVFLLYLIISILFVSIISSQISYERLPIFINGNNDIFNYANHSIILISDDPKNYNNWINTDLIDAIKKDVFGATIWLSIPSIIFNEKPIEVTSSAIIAASSVFGLLIYELNKIIFNQNKPISIISMIFTILAPGFMFILSYYFLAQILFYSIFIVILIKTFILKYDEDTRLLKLVFNFFPYYFILFLVYPYLLISFLPIHLLLLIFKCSRVSKLNSGLIIKTFIFFPIGIFCIIYLIFPEKTMLNITFILQTIHSERTSNQIISLSSVFGYPFSGAILDGNQTNNNVVLFFIYSYIFLIVFRLHKQERYFIIKNILFLFILFLIQYIVVYAHYGNSYQLIKFSTFYFVPFSALILLLVPYSFSFAFQPIVTVAMVLIIVIFSIFNYRNSEIGKFSSYSSGFRNLISLNYLKQIDTIYFDGFNFGEIMLLGQYIVEKNKIPTSQSYYNFKELDLDKVSSNFPILMKGTCNYEFEGKLEILGGYTLINKIPSLTLNKRLNFDQAMCHLLQNIKGMSNPENGGRWTSESNIQFDFTLDEKLLKLNHLYINIELEPFIIKNIVPKQEFTISINEIDIGKYSIDDSDKTIIRIPLRPEFSNRKIHLSIDIPTSTSPYSIDNLNSDTRKLGLFLKSLEIIHDDY